jgi:hypothetical protein
MKKLAICLLAVSGFASAHGAPEMDVVVEGKKLLITLESPADNLLGFEHKPKNDTEKAKLKAVSEQLQNASNLFTIDASAQCKAAAPSVKMPDFAKGGHSDIDAEYHFECAAIPANISLPLWKNFAGFKSITDSKRAKANQT